MICSFSWMNEVKLYCRLALLACLYKCIGKAIALSLALTAAVAKCLSFYVKVSELQIRRGIEDNSKIIFFISQ